MAESLNSKQLALKVAHQMLAKRIQQVLDDPNLSHVQSSIYQTVLELNNKISRTKLLSQYNVLLRQASHMTGSAKAIVQQQSVAYVNLIAWWTEYARAASFIWDVEIN